LLFWRRCHLPFALRTEGVGSCGSAIEPRRTVAQRVVYGWVVLIGQHTRTAVWLRRVCRSQQLAPAFAGDSPREGDRIMAVIVFALFAAHVIAWVALPDRKSGDSRVVQMPAAVPAMA